MCGIIGYSGKDNAIPYLINGIKELEYRGYDSFGCAVESKNELVIEKGVGAVSKVISSTGISKLVSKRGIFHTRWATNGRVSERNAHPVTDCSGKLAVAHNGIIENWKELKRRLASHSFRSNTDTEVLAHLIEELMGNGLSPLKAVKQAGSMIDGASSFVVMGSNTNEIIAFKKGSPLILALGQNGIFISSDVPSILRYTKRVIYLHDGDLVSFTDSSYKIENIYDPKATHPELEVSLEIKSTSKGKYGTYMEKEIHEQPELWKSMENYPIDKIQKAVRLIEHNKRVYLIASGTSYHASLFGSMLLRKAGVNALAIQPQEYESYAPFVTSEDVIILISQSGETADIISILPQIQRNKKIGIVNVERSHIASKVDLLLEMNSGLEKGVAATKTMTSTLMILTALASSVSDKNESYLADLKLLNKRVYDFLVPSVIESIDDITSLICGENDIYFVGKGFGHVLAQEGALKMKEISYVHAESIDLATVKHGPLALFSDGTKVIAVIANGSMKESSYNLEEVKARGAFIIGISDSRSYLFDRFIRVPSVKSYSFAPILMALQLLALKVAVKKGLDPDRPRNLAKSVTVR